MTYIGPDITEEESDRLVRLFMESQIYYPPAISRILSYLYDGYPPIQANLLNCSAKTCRIYAIEDGTHSRIDDGYDLFCRDRLLYDCRALGLLRYDEIADEFLLKRLIGYPFMPDSYFYRSLVTNLEMVLI